MKRYAMIVACLTLLVSPRVVRAQTSNVQIGPEAGVSLATFVGSDANDAESRMSPYFGGNIVFHRPGSALGFQSGLLYVPKGAKFTFDGGKAALEIGYIEIPLLLRLGLPLQGSRILPALLLGGSVGIKTSCDLSGKSGSSTASVGCEDSAFEGQLDLKSIDFGIAIGAEVGIPAGTRMTVAPSIRYTRGISVIGDTSNNADLTNSVFQVGIGLRFRL